MSKMHPECDGGIHSNILILPKAALSGPITELVDNELPPKPMFVFINSKSGGQQGPKLLEKMNYLLNNVVQIFELIPDGPGVGLTLIKHYMDSNPHNAKNVRIVVCGGDGTAGWLLQAMAAKNMNVPLGIIPLGTGNDLARTLGWGPGYTGESIPNLLHALENASMGTLDRWNVAFTPQGGGADEVKTMTNYFSIGVDAKVALSFHQQREATPEQFTNRFVNFLWYTKFGANAIFDGCINLPQEVKLEVDGKETPLPGDLQGLIVVNLPSYAAGLNMWGNEIPHGTRKQSIEDGLVEVVGVEGSAHIGQIQTGFSQCIKIAQGRVVKITYLKKEGAYPVQVDGEPWLQDPTIITVSRRDQVPVLVNFLQQFSK